MGIGCRLMAWRLQLECDLKIRAPALASHQRTMARVSLIMGRLFDDASTGATECILSELCCGWGGAAATCSLASVHRLVRLAPTLLFGEQGSNRADLLQACTSWHSIRRCATGSRTLANLPGSMYIFLDCQGLRVRSLLGGMCIQSCCIFRFTLCRSGLLGAIFRGGGSFRQSLICAFSHLFQCI